MSKLAPTPRRDGWTAARRQVFLKEFEATGSVGLAIAAVAGPSASSLYRLCRRDAGFAAQLRAAEDARWVARASRISARAGIYAERSRALTFTSL